MRLFGRGKRVPDAPPTYWNGAVIDRIERDGGVDHETAVVWWNEMLLFLDMVAVSKEFVSPPEPVDLAWHAFILHTQDYESYCRDRYGRIIHHQPTGKPDPHAYGRAYERRSAYTTPVDNTVWPIPVVVTSGGDDRPSSPGGDFAAGAATIGGADFAGGDGAPGGLDGAGGGDFSDAGGGTGEASGDAGAGDSGGSSCGGSSCGGSSCGGGSS